MKKVASVAGTVPPGPFSVAELRQESPALVIFGSIFLVSRCYSRNWGLFPGTVCAIFGRSLLVEE